MIYKDCLFNLVLVIEDAGNSSSSGLHIYY